MGEVTMPRLSDTMSEGTVGRWLKQPGDQVSAGDIIAEIETDKATMELESFESGILQKVIIPAGKTVPIGEVIALIGNGALAEPSPPPVASPPPASPPPTPVQAPASVPTPVSDDHARLLVSPVARRIAEELNVDLRQVQGSGPGGRIIKENVEEFAARRAPAAPPAPVAPPAPAAPPAPTATAQVAPLSRMRKAIARAMNESKPGVPHIYVTVEVSVDALMALREQLNATGTRISVNDLVVKAAARALVKVPALNSSLTTMSDGQLGVAQHAAINIGVAVSLDDGLIAPVVRDADKKSIGTLSGEIREMAARAREGKIRQQDLEGATFQVTNLGMFGVVEFGSIITVPQAASLAVGAVRKLPVVRDDQIVVGQVMNLTLSADHRVVDGAVAARYLKELQTILEAPLGILM